MAKKVHFSDSIKGRAHGRARKISPTTGILLPSLEVLRRWAVVPNGDSIISDVFRRRSPAGDQEPPEKEFPGRFRIIRRLGVEVIRKIGRRLDDDDSIDRPWVANLGRYRLNYYTQFNPPAGRRRRHWNDASREQFKLIISDTRGPVCLDVVWTDCSKTYLQTRDPKGNDWDRDFRKRWEKYLKRALRR